MLDGAEAGDDRGDPERAVGLGAEPLECVQCLGGRVVAQRDQTHHVSRTTYPGGGVETQGLLGDPQAQLGRHDDEQVGVRGEVEEQRRLAGEAGLAGPTAQDALPELGALLLVGADERELLVVVGRGDLGGRRVDDLPQARADLAHRQGVQRGVAHLDQVVPDQASAHPVGAQHVVEGQPLLGATPPGLPRRAVDRVVLVRQPLLPHGRAQDLEHPVDVGVAGQPQVVQGDGGAGGVVGVDADDRLDQPVGDRIHPLVAVPVEEGEGRAVDGGHGTARPGGLTRRGCAAGTTRPARPW